jgi:hypothetical protein
MKEYPYEGARSTLCSCGKVCFDKKTAETKANFLHKLGKVKKLTIYPCKESGKWHLTKGK